MHYTVNAELPYIHRSIAIQSKQCCIAGTEFMEGTCRPNFWTGGT